MSMSRRDVLLSGSAASVDFGATATPVSLGTITIPEFNDDPFPQLHALAERLGVPPIAPSVAAPSVSYGLTIQSGDRVYDVFALVNAVLDRLDGATKP